MKFLLLAGLALASDVIVLTKDSYDKFVTSEPLSLVEFYAPWCGHCQQLAPEYEKAATDLKGSVKIAKVDCTVEKDVCGKEKVQGYPTLKVFRSGTSTDYKGPRKAQGIVSYMKKQSLPALSVLAKGEIADFKEKDNVAVVGFFTKGSKEFEDFSAVAEKLRDEFIFGYSEDAAAAQEHGVTVPGVALFKKFDDGKAILGKVTQESVTEFVRAEGVPLMGEIGPENYGDYVNRKLPIAYLFYSDEADKINIGRPVVEPLAKEFKGKLSFVYIDATKYAGHAGSLNLPSKWPGFAIQDPEKNTKFPYASDFKIEKLREFVSGVVSGTIQPSFKSQPIPETNDEPVKIVVNKNYDDIVRNAENDVFLKVYAPWCGHCKKLAPIWEQLAKKVPAGSNIVVAKFDGSENDLPSTAGFEIRGFPDLKLYKAKTNELVSYEGDRSLGDLLKFLKKNAVNGKALMGINEDEEESESAEPEHDEL